MEPRPFETWSRNYIFNKNLLQSVWKDARKKKIIGWSWSQNKGQMWSQSRKYSGSQHWIKFKVPVKKLKRLWRIWHFFYMYLAFLRHVSRQEKPSPPSTTLEYQKIRSCIRKLLLEILFSSRLFDPKCILTVLILVSNSDPHYGRPPGTGSAF